MITLGQVDQSVLMKNVGSNPCYIALSVSTAVYDGNKLLKTVRVDRKGTYISSPNTLVWGGTTDVSLSGKNLRLVTTANAGGIGCYGGDQFSWTTNLP
jgi:hypothetical protein